MAPTIASLAAAAALVPLVSGVLGGKDIVVLKDGRIVQGPPMTRVETGIEIAYENGKVLVPSELVLDSVLAEDAHAPPLTDEERAQAAKGFVRFEGKWVTPEQREGIVAKRVEKRRAELEEAKAHTEWRNRYVEETKLYRYEHTVPKHLFDPYRDAMEAYTAQLAKEWKLPPPKGGFRLPVCFHLDRATFQQISGMPQGVLGYFDPVRKDLNVFYERLDPGQTEDTMFHEANHYLQHRIEPMFWMPHFPGESIAEYYGACRWDPVAKKLEVGLVQEGRLCEIQTDVAAGERIGIATLITSKDEGDRYKHYTWGWSLVHFLMHDDRYAAKFQRFFLKMPEAKGVERIAMDANGRRVSGLGWTIGSFYTYGEDDVLALFVKDLGLKGADALRKLEAEWHGYVDESLKLVSTQGLEKAGLKALQVGRVIRGERLLKEAIAKGSRNPLVFHRLAERLAEEGKRSEAMDVWKRALELDPLNGSIYARMAFFLPDDAKEERRRLQGLARELGTDDFWANLDLEVAVEKPAGDPGAKPPPAGPPSPPSGG